MPKATVFQKSAGIRIFWVSFICLLVEMDGILLPGGAPLAAEEPAIEKTTAPGEETVAPSGAVPKLDPVVVAATRVASEAARVPAAVSVLEREDIQQGRPAVKLKDALNRVPGVFAQNALNFAQDLRISIRGFGARSAFGIRGIQIYADGLPLTLPDGQSTLDTIDPNNISRLEVIRGPLSSLYGNASGGVINIVTEEGPQDPFWEARSVIGEYASYKNLLKGGGQTGRFNYFAALSHVETDGFREHSQAESTVFNSKLRYDIDESSDVTLILNAANTPEARDPGGLTAAQARSDPTQAGSLNRVFETGESISDQRLGVVYRRQLAADQNLEAAAFYNRRDLENAIPFLFIEVDRQVAGGRAQYDLSGNVFGRPHRLVSGIDLQYQIDDRKNFDNVGGAAGDNILLAQEEAVTSFGFYLQEEIDLTPAFSVLLGGRYDNVNFDIDDRLLADTDDSGSKRFDQVTGRVGIMTPVHPNVRLYGSIAQSFETPTSTELVNRPEGGGGINPDIAPQTAVNYELGLKAEVADNFRLDAALFFIDLQDELVAFRDVGDRVYFRNAGESQRAGVELGLAKTLWPGVALRLSYTYLKAVFKTYERGGMNLDGNAVPGLPEHLLFTELRYAHSCGFYAAGNLQYIGEFYVDDENTLENDAATVVDLRFGYEKKFDRWLIEPFFGVRNLLNESYNDNVRINATGGRYFEPAPETNIYGGIRVRYQPG
jgi:iron complex outermembrane receptor protein